MVKIMFVCHGNICRSPMAEFVFRHMVEERHLSKEFSIASSATSREEIGNSVHRGTKGKLREVGISCEGKTAVQLTKKDYESYDYIICMESYNIKNVLRIIGEDKLGKVHRMLDFSACPRDIADPWYTGNFDETYKDILDGCEALLNYVLKNEAMAMRFEKSCGAVVYRYSDDAIEFLVIRSKSFGHWGFPKGHVEEGESEEETARREVLEETGLNISICDGFRSTMEYKVGKGTLKEVVLFLGRYSGGNVSIQKEEVQDYRWLGYNEALELLTFDSDRKVLAEVKNAIV